MMRDTTFTTSHHAREISIGGRKVGAGHPSFVIAELSANHGGSYERAEQLVRMAREVGADAVKLQTLTPDGITLNSDNEYFRIAAGTVWDGRVLYDLYRETAMPWEWQPRLKRLADALGIILFSSPFDSSAVEFLDTMDIPCFKIASPEIVDIGLIKLAAATGKPLIISTGMATRAEIEEAVAAARASDATGIALLKCTSTYPALPEEMDLRTIPDMAESFDLTVGVSDHTLGMAVAVTAVALGATIVEKHFTLSRADGGPDSGFSVEPTEFAEMVREIRVAEKALGSVNYEPTPREAASRTLRRSLFVVDDVRAGDLLTPENVRSIRPGQGLHTRHLPDVLGRRAARDIARGTPLSWALVRVP
jgi:N-acetylneuraminate synthase